jgi:signal transduction histidine kinase
MDTSQSHDLRTRGAVPRRELGRVWAALAAALLILAGIGAVSVDAALENRTLSRERTRVRLLLFEMQGLLAALQDAETGQRGFLLTGDDAYLELYHAGRAEVDPRLAAIDRLGDPARTATVDLQRLRPLIVERLAILTEGIDARRVGGLDAALPVIGSGRGKRVMDELRRSIATQQHGISRMLEERIARAEALGLRALVFLIAGSLTSVGLVVVSFVWLRREIADRREVEAALRDSERTQRRLSEGLTGRTEQLEAAMAELSAAKERAEAADRLKSAFLATMSHELRTPLNSIIGFTGILLQGLAGPLNLEQRTQLGMVQASARHLLALINDVLDISKIEAGELKVARAPYDLRAVLEHAVASVRPSAEARGLALRVDVSPEVGRAVGDGHRVEQILLNLLNNAIKFTARGEVVVSVDLDADATCRIRVTDTGIGIRPEDLVTLFTPFRQIDAGLARSHEGTGLGLAICRRLAGLLGGDIRAESVWGRGSVFTLTLPLEGPVPA